MLSNLDNSVGQVLKKLRSVDLEKNTLVFFISDNGGPTRELTSSNAPLRGGKGDVYKRGIRVPFLVQWTGTLPVEKVYHNPVVSLDVFAAAAKAPTPHKHSLNSIDLIPFLLNLEASPPPCIVLAYGSVNHRACASLEIVAKSPSPIRCRMVTVRPGARCQRVEQSGKSILRQARGNQKCLDTSQ